MKISVKLIEHNDEFIANCPELDINCYGSNKNEAIRRIKSVIDFYVDSAKELGIDIDSIQELNIDDEATTNETKISQTPSTILN